MSLRELNQEIEGILLHDQEAGTVHGKVCLVCDKFVDRKEQSSIGLKTFLKHASFLKGDSIVSPALRQCYKFSIPGDEQSNTVLNDCLLSPRSRVLYSDKRKKHPKLLCCKDCKSGLTPKKLRQGDLPRFAIANGMTIGTPPSCLERLNEIELALVSQARFRGHLFTYWGGCHRSIKGWHSFYEVNPGHTTAVLEGVTQLTESKNIAVVLCGPFTPEQKEKVLKKVQVNVEWVLEAFEWLKENNRLYINVPVPVIEAPTVIDNSHSVEAENSDIETKEEVKVVFPDGTIRTGGCDDGAAFDKAISEIRSKCGEAVPFLTSRPSRKLLRDYEDENLMRAFPLQFPYGYGYHEDFNVKASQNGYLKHLVSLSIPAFHEASFVLVVHNMFERCRALNGAVWQVMAGREKCDVSEEELNHAISRQLDGLPAVNGPGGDFLKSVQAVKKNMAHTNATAKAAQAKFLSLSHHFGCAKVLFTVAFDDSLDIRILALSGKEDTLSWISSLDNLAADELSHEMDQLNALRYKYPGLCALNFEYLLDIILDKLVGDNDLRTGLFGKLAAYGLAVEEQGRKTLHAHILVYTTEWNEILRALHSNREKTRQAAEKKVAEFVDMVMSTELIPGAPSDLKCPECGEGSIMCVEDQQLRNLRHRVGCRVEKGIFSHCSKCEKQFQGDELALKRAVSKENWDMSEEEVKAQVALQVLKATSNEAPSSVPTEIIGLTNYRFNHHLDRHTKTCFKKGEEGRCSLPDIAEDRTHILYSESKYELFDWTGNMRPQCNITIRPKRLPQDAYTNSYCKAISACKAPSNSNVSVTTGARSTIYTSCYASKGTQKEDSSEFKKMASYVGNRFSEQRNENTLFEGLSRLMGSVIVGTCEHVCAAPMAAYLVRNQSRFKFSVNFKYIPVRELVNLITKTENRETMKMSILGHDTGCFLTSEALHYLQRPKKFEDKCLTNFFVEYEVVRKTARSDNDNTVTFDIDDKDHPGYQKQIIRQRKVPVIAQFSHWLFPDASSFGGSIFDMKQYPVNSSVENFCRTVLVLYHPFRSMADVTIDGSYHKKFMSLFHNGVPSHIKEVLSNVQMFYNSMRLPPREDPLYNKTIQFKSDIDNSIQEESDEEDDDTFFDGVFNVLAGTEPARSNSPSTEDTSKMSLYNLRKDGARGCGFHDLPPIEALTTQGRPRMTSLVSTIQPNHVAQVSPVEKKDNKGRDRPTLNQLMELTYRNTRRRILEANTTQEGSIPVSPTSADGTVLSIIEWSMRQDLNLDKDQQLAFQIATAAYVITYYDDAQQVNPSIYRAENGGNIRSQMRHDFINEKTKLRKLARLLPNTPLRMFLDGAGGSGKSRVVGEILKYAKEYTTRLNLTFDMRTIVVTAVSGVAATSIGGETVHSAAALNRGIKEDDVSWANARLLIIDEVSFMSTKEVETLDEKLRCLLRKHNALFGGIHILFCGDFRQLEPVKGRPLYSTLHTDKKWVNSINCYVELRGMHRFKDDPEWGHILQRLRSDTYTQHDIDAINEQLINDPRRGRREAPGGSSYCVYMNADRTAINAGIFSNILKAHWKQSTEQPLHMLVVKASKMLRVTKSGRKVEMGSDDRQFIYENCGDHRLQSRVMGRKGHFVDPMLKLYYQAPLMLVSNDDVPNGHANGTRVLLEAVVLNENKTTETVCLDGLNCPAVEASWVDHFVCSLEEHPGKIFHIKPRDLLCSAKAPIPRDIGGSVKATIKFNMSLIQLPLVVNNATTGHKLQGQTKKNLVISVWSNKKNWNYVALSRVQTRKGLHLVRELSYTTDFSISSELRHMMHVLSFQSPEAIEWNLDDEHAILETRRRHSSNNDH